MNSNIFEVLGLTEDADQATLTSETHIYAWINQPAKNDGERFAKDWFDKFCRPADEKWKMNGDNSLARWLDDNPLFCTYEGQTYRVTGASRLGDVWLTLDLCKNQGYEKRVDVADCSDWRKP